MADMALQVVVSPLLGVVFDKLSSPLLKEFGLLWGVQKDLEKLSNTTSTIRRVLQDAELKQIHDGTTRDWLRKLKEAAYKADDAIEECIANDFFSPDSEVGSGSCSTQVGDCFSNCFDFKRLKLRHKIAKQIKEIQENFDEIAGERKFHLNERSLEMGSVEDSSHYRETTSEVLEDFVYGRDMVKEKIVGILLNNVSDKDNFLVYSVIGMGGLGKTTLAQCVYRDTNIKKNFYTRIWVCVSEVFHTIKITKAIIESVSKAKCDLENLDALQSRLKDLLTGKKFLLVLDDVWNEDPGSWDKIKFPLKCGAKGSSIIVTTRSSKVAQIMGPLHGNQHMLAPLSDEECWSLFKGRAFDGEVITNSELEVIGKEIVKKCGGVPLAAKALGGSLRSEREVNVWRSISTSEIWELKEDGGILPSLKLSYNHLSPYMKQCFSYCSIFPKDYEIKIAELIQWWMANGLVQSEGKLDLEDVGRRTFKELLWKSFFQDVERVADGQETCKMHDLMHDLACLVGENECLALDGGGEMAKIPMGVRHLSTFVDRNYIPNSNNLKCLSESHPFLRTFVLMGLPRSYYQKDNMVFESLRCLRILDLSRTKIEVIPMSIGKMKHLRYLNLSETKIVCLPSSLCGLKTLQTLKLRVCHELRKLPDKMNSLVNLIHLDLYMCSALTQMPPGIGELVRLRTLERFIVGCGNGQSIKELRNLDKLEGCLEIEELEQVKDATEARVANLSAKTNLVDISLNWYGTPQQGNKEEEVFEALQPHPHLSGVLHVSGYTGSRFPSWIQNLEKLSAITLLNCGKCEDLPPLGHLLLLKRLRVYRMDSLKRVNKEFYGISSRSQNSVFPSLESLEIGEFPNLEEWEALDDTHELFPRLQTLEVRSCPKLALLPSALLSSLQNLQISDCEKLVVRSLPCLPHLTFSDISSIPMGSLQNLEALESLVFGSCNFPNIPPQIFEQVTSLKSLEISNCHSLTSLSQSLQHLSSLETLFIKDCRELEFSSTDFQHLLALQTLTLVYLPKLTSIPNLQHLLTLQTLEISSCLNLKVLPHSFHNLTSLHTLKFSGCNPDLETKCMKDIGEYWPYISHIANLDIIRKE